MFKKLFGLKDHPKTPTEETIFTPLSGKVTELTDVPDPTFSQKMMGDGLAIIPTDGEVVSPVNGEIIQFFHTKHAIGIRSESGAEILIHVGLETVSMNGEGFVGHVKEGDKVKVGDKLISCDLNLIKEKAANIITPIVITNSDQVESLDKKISENAIKGQTEFLHLKMKR
ncbi:PTS sugar transporter subunit IIA [Sutcliffiella rhizosphaerae]|uniref:PTS system glucose-specific EIIA component n=1 Tax=Sutcliffiella rhizosphaerae TaxID=2880967 RepID=A0ABN8A830_9BACI|nr:PTS glucose transporter subunit IIA [Sutcliffiella rhizosphaerae]CAG9619926.1 PTS system glucose-specific EIIA component [Sutcliffiella rhizosphaerae]